MCDDAISEPGWSILPDQHRPHLESSAAELSATWAYLRWPERRDISPPVEMPASYVFAGVRVLGPGERRKTWPVRRLKRGERVLFTAFIAQRVAADDVAALDAMLERERPWRERAAQALGLDPDNATWRAVTERRKHVVDAWLAYAAEHDYTVPGFMPRTRAHWLQYLAGDGLERDDWRFDAEYDALRRVREALDRLYPRMPEPSSEPRIRRLRGHRRRAEDDPATLRDFRTVEEALRQDKRLSIRAACTRVGLPEDTFYRVRKRLKERGRYPLS